MTRLKTALLTLLSVLLLLGAAGAETLQDCHRVSMDKHDSTEHDGIIVREWIPETACADVDMELFDIRQDFRDNIVPNLPAAGNKTSKNSRLDIETRYSRTGTKWMSFVIQARTTYHRQLTGQEIVTRTYDMTTGERIFLTDLFDDESPAWNLMAERVGETLNAYFPDEQADENLLASYTSRDALELADFSLHGMSLVLHYPANALYPKHHTLMEVKFYYPEIRQYMTSDAYRQTDNDNLYKLCALTFDDGPVRDNSTAVLNSLMKTGSLATFFVIGNLVEGAQDIVQKEHDNGHTVASHNYHHGNVKNSSAANLRAMKDKVDKVFYPAIGITAPFDRVPYGLYPQMIKAKVGWTYIQWSVDTYDWRGRSSSQVLNVVKKQCEDGDIILCHDIKDNTPKSAELICDWLAENGFMMLTVDELFAKDRVELEPNTVVYRCVNGDTSIKK